MRKSIFLIKKKVLYASSGSTVGKGTGLNQTFALQCLINLSGLSCLIYKMERNAISGCNYALVNGTLCQLSMNSKRNKCLCFLYSQEGVNVELS